MSELTTRFIDDTYSEYYNTGKHELAQIYLKSEADKVIAEKDKEIAQLQAMLEERNKQVGELKKACNDKDDWCLHILKENRHHKYKRCLSRWLYLRECYWRCLNHNEPTKADWYLKWMDNFQKLAEKFKEAK